LAGRHGAQCEAFFPQDTRGMLSIELREQLQRCLSAPASDRSSCFLEQRELLVQGAGGRSG